MRGDTDIHILFVENSDGLGGSTISLGTLLPALDRRRYHCALALSRPAQRQYLEQRRTPNDGMRVITCRPSLKASRWGRALLAAAPHRSLERGARLLLSLLDLPLVIAPYGLRLASFARSRRVDLIHHNNGFDLTTVLVAKILRVPLVAYQRGWEYDSRALRRLGNAVTRFVANSGMIRDHLVGLGIDRDRIDVVHPPIDLTRFDPSLACAHQRHEFGLDPGVPSFGIVGALLEYRGQHVFLHAAAQVLRAVPEARVFVIGSAPDGDVGYRDQLRGLAHELGIAERVVFTGHRDDVAELMQMLDVVVHAALILEPFGRVIAEAMAMGKPVVATDGGGPREIIRDGQTGFLVPRGEAAPMAARIITLLTDQKLAARMGRAGAAAVRRRFAAEPHAARMQDIYTDVLGLPRRGAASIGPGGTRDPRGPTAAVRSSNI